MMSVALLRRRRWSGRSTLQQRYNGRDRGIIYLAPLHVFQSLAMMRDRDAGA